MIDYELNEIVHWCGAEDPGTDEFLIDHYYYLPRIGATWKQSLADSLGTADGVVSFPGSYFGVVSTDILAWDEVSPVNVVNGVGTTTWAQWGIIPEDVFAEEVSFPNILALVDDDLLIKALVATENFFYLPVTPGAVSSDFEVCVDIDKRWKRGRVGEDSELVGKKVALTWVRGDKSMTQICVVKPGDALPDPRLHTYFAMTHIPDGMGGDSDE